jgi:hypothetical protein
MKEEAKKPPRPEDKAPLVDAKVEHTHQRDEPHYKIMVGKVDKLSRNSVDPVPVSINGVQYAIRRGKIAFVPECVVEALKNSVELSYEAEDGNVENRVATEVQSYPFQIMEGPMPAEAARAQQKKLNEAVAA